MNKQEKNTILPWVVGIGLLIFIIYLIYALKPILWPFLVSAGIAYVLIPSTNKLEIVVRKREIAILINMFITFLIIVIFLAIVIPILITQFINFMTIVPSAVEAINAHILPMVDKYLGINLNFNYNLLFNILKDNQDEVQKALAKLFSIIQKKGLDAIDMLVGLVLIPFLIYYFLGDWSKWKASIYNLIPRKIYPEFLSITKRIDEIIMEFLKGQVSVMILMGIVYGIALSLVGLKNGFVIGIISGFLVFIPYLGALVGALLVFLTAIVQYTNVYLILLVLGVFFCCHLLEGFIITPKLVGNRIGLSPLLVLFSLMAFGKLLGFVGVLLALPLASISSVLIKEGINAYKHSNFYKA